MENSMLTREHSPLVAAQGVRAIAVFEGIKGSLVLLAGCGLLSLLHRDLQAAAETIVRHSHLNPARHYPRVFIEAAAHTNDGRLRSLAALAFLYASVRFIEAYGLWRMRAWAEWFAILSGAIYLPIELYELLKRPTWVRAAILFLNLLVVLYLIWVRYSRSSAQLSHANKLGTESAAHSSANND